MELFREQIEHPNKASRGGLRRRRTAVPAAQGIAPRLQESLTPTAVS